MPDFIFTCHGSIWLVRPLNEGAQSHLQENVQENSMWMGKSLVVEPRYVAGLAEGLQSNGYEVQA